MSSSRLLLETQRLWRQRDRSVSLTTIAERTGLTRFWLHQFDQNITTAPAVDKVERLYNFLSGKQLDL